jgi:predicted DNA-binding transcriptional regulator AlpA
MLEMNNRQERRRAEALDRAGRNDEIGGDPLLNSGAMREYCGQISEMTVWRWSRDHDFPRPDLILNKRRFWRRSTLDGWLARMSAM